MKISVIAFSLTGLSLAEKLEDGLSGHNEVDVYVKSIHADNSIKESLNQWAEARFQDSDALIFVCSCGIAVRAIAPFVRSKKTDPAVIAVDELGLNAIALLSGHLGGANELAADVARIAGGRAVITTATDIHGKYAPDVFAKKNGLVISDFTQAKKYAALQIQNREDEMDLWISPFCGEPGEDERDYLWLIPKWAYVGIGCRRNTDESTINDVFEEALKACSTGRLDPRSIRTCASVTLKADEKGLQDFCSNRGLDIEFFTPEELEAVPGEYTESDFVRETVGVGSVCERSAMAAALRSGAVEAGQPEPCFTLKKFARDGVTIAIVIKEEELKYE